MESVKLWGCGTGFLVPLTTEPYVMETARQPNRSRKTCGKEDDCDGFFGSSDGAKDLAHARSDIQIGFSLGWIPMNERVLRGDHRVLHSQVE
jgi:hypothetical protein